MGSFGSLEQAATPVSSSSKVRVLLFALLVAMPLVAIAWLGARLIGDEKTMQEAKRRSLARERLHNVRTSVSHVVDTVSASIEKELGRAPLEHEGLRNLRRKSPLFRELFVLEPSGVLSFPPSGPSASAQERAFLKRTARIWKQQAALYRPPEPETQRRSKRSRFSSRDSVLALARERKSGWMTWYWEEGLHLLYWVQGDGGRVVGAQIERVALLARLVGSLSIAVFEGTLSLSDSKGETLVQWGAEAKSPKEPPFDRLSLLHPLDAWGVAYRPRAVSPALGFGANSFFGFFMGFAALAVALFGMVVYLYREQTRDLRDAAQKVGFVTSVSHELRTPLTNIRLYAELLEEELSDSEGETHARLQVITSESQRLSRLINNILAFSRQERGLTRLRKVDTEVDGLVQSVLAQFALSLKSKGIQVHVDLNAPKPIAIDPDSVEQILANLVSNVEKYTDAGGALNIWTTQDRKRTEITVSDDGPGIPSKHQRAIFSPFFRVHNHLTEGVSGTGIGLSIARDLAELNGGMLELVPSSRGACFRLRLGERRADTS